MKKRPVETTASELADILARYFAAAHELNYAVKIVGHPGVGKSAIVKEAAARMNFHYIDTRLAFKENVDLGGYPVPRHEEGRMVYYRPRFIPPERVPEGRAGIVWFLDEANRAHPTVIQTLFQIITERTCGEHSLPANTAIVLAGNLGEADSTTITEFDDSALDGRLAIFHLRPSAPDWLAWAESAGVHPSVTRYISLYPERLWDEANIDPNPRGWHQVSLAVSRSYGLEDEDSFRDRLRDDPGGTLEKTVRSLVGGNSADDFIAELTAPRALSTEDVLSCSAEKLALLDSGGVPAEDLLWALAGAVRALREWNLSRGDEPSGAELDPLRGFLVFAGHARSDVRAAFFHRLVREAGIFSLGPAALARVPDPVERKELESLYATLLGN